MLTIKWFNSGATNYIAAAHIVVQAPIVHVYDRDGKCVVLSEGYLIIINERGFVVDEVDLNVVVSNAVQKQETNSEEDYSDNGSGIHGD